MDLKDYLRFLRRSWITLVTCALLGLMIAGAISFFMKPKYTAEMQLFVAIQSAGDIAELQQGNTYGQARVQSYVKVATTPTVLQPAIERLGLAMTPGQLAPRVTASAVPNTVFISIAATDESPVQAASIAQAVGRSLIEAVGKLESPANASESPVKLSIITPATAPLNPSSPNIPLNLAVGLLGGLAIGVGIAALRTTVDSRVRGEADIRRITNAPILGGITFDADASRKPLLTQVPPQSPRAESFRQMRTNLQFAHVSHKERAVLITSSLPAEGKTTTALNLAIALSQAGQRVALIDADLRRPMVAEHLGLERNAGLTTALLGRAAVEDLLQPWGTDELHVLTSGQIPPNPSELLGSDAMKSIILQLEQSFDAVIVDAPPLLPVTDAAVLAQQVGGVALVVGVQKLKVAELEKSLGALEMVQADVLGVILNMLPSKGPDAYMASYYSYESKAAPGRSAQSQETRASRGVETPQRSVESGARFRANRSF